MCIHRGTKQIGGKCIEIERDGVRIVLDVGLPLDGDGSDESLVPQIASNLAAILISHPHVDHYGLLHHLPPGTPVCIGAAARRHGGTAARRIIRAAAPFTGQPVPSLNGKDLEHRTPIEIGPFRITPDLVDHSAYDAYALLVEAGEKRIFYSGDIRAHGRKARLFDALVEHPPKDVDVLLMEGLSLSRLDDEGEFPTEADLERAMLEHFRATPGLVMAHASAQNIDRIVTLYRACRRSGRTLLIDPYTAAVLEATGNDHVPQSSWPNVALFVPQRQRRQIARNQAFELLKRHATQRVFPEDLKALAPRAALLFRPLHLDDLDAAECLEGAGFIHSQWTGYLQYDASQRWQQWLRQRGIAIDCIHTSGHASPPDLRRLAQALSPARLVPIHSFAPEKYPLQFSRVDPRQDGEWWVV